MPMIYMYVSIFLILGIVLFIYSKKKNWTIGISTSILMFLIVFFSFFTNMYEELSLSNEEFKKDLQHLNVELKDEFVIVTNKIIEAPEKIRETKIQISINDKERILKEIRNSSNLKSYLVIRSKAVAEENSEILNFIVAEGSGRYTFKKINGISTRYRLFIHHNDNVLGLEKTTR